MKKRNKNQPTITKTKYKTCSICKKQKPATAEYFALAKKRIDGLASRCRECKRAYDRVYSRAYRKRNPEWKKNDNLRNRELIKKCVKRWIKNNPKKARAVYSLNRAIRKKRIIKQPCIICGEDKKVDGHHHDYSKPLDVIWLCHKHHMKLHAGIITMKDIKKLMKKKYE